MISRRSAKALASLLIIGAIPLVVDAAEDPDFTIQYSWDGTQVVEGGTYNFSTGVLRNAEYIWPGGSAIGLQFRGKLHNATKLNGHGLGVNGVRTELNHFPVHDDYFIVIHYFPPWADSTWGKNVDDWFKTGTTVNPFAHAPISWGIRRFKVGIPQSPPTLSNLGQFKKFGVDSISEGEVFVGNESVFKATLTDSDSTEVKLEIEVKPHDMPFDGSAVTSPLAPVGEFEITIDELIPTTEHYLPGGNEESFHWRARAVDVEGNASEWVEYGTDQSSPDFTAKVVPLWTQVQSDFPEDSGDWAGEMYASGVDYSCSKSDPLNATIAKCGCAISSLVMIASYYGIEEGIDDNPITPLNIDAWLRENAGYIGENFVSWAKAEEYLGMNIDGAPHKVLALDRDNFKTASIDVVDAYLSQQAPVIAFNATAGHYLVMDTKVQRPGGETYTVRDPRWYRTETLDDPQNLASDVKGYGNAFTHATIFTKLSAPTKLAAHTEFYLASPAELLVTDPLGRRTGNDPVTGTAYFEIPGASYYLEDPIASSDVDIDPSTVHHVKVLALPELSDGEYDLRVIGTGTGEYTLTAAMTDATGSTTMKTFTATTVPNEVDEYVHAVVDGAPEETAPAALTVPELVLLLKKAIADSSAKSLVKAALQIQIVAFEKAYAKNKLREARLIIVALEAEVQFLKKKTRLSSADAELILSLLQSVKLLL